MNNFLKKVIGDKQAWNKIEARAKALPRDYQVVYDEIKNYMWNLWRFSASAACCSEITPNRACSATTVWSRVSELACPCRIR